MRYPVVAWQGVLSSAYTYRLVLTSAPEQVMLGDDDWYEGFFDVELLTEDSMGGPCWLTVTDKLVKYEAIITTTTGLYNENQALKVSATRRGASTEDDRGQQYPPSDRDYPKPQQTGD